MLSARCLSVILVRGSAGLYTAHKLSARPGSETALSTRTGSTNGATPDRSPEVFLHGAFERYAVCSLRKLQLPLARLEARLRAHRIEPGETDVDVDAGGVLYILFQFTESGSSLQCDIVIAGYLIDK